MSTTSDFEKSNRILVVEDEQDICRLIALHLERMGHAVDFEHDGEKACQRLQHTVYDLVILDWMLPSLSGIELMRLIRRRESRFRICQTRNAATKNDPYIPWVYAF